MWDDRGDGYDMMNGGGLVMGIGLVILVLVGLALVAVLANLYLHLTPRSREATPPPTVPSTQESEARRLLDRRLALGEISTEEYASIRAVLDG